MKDSVTRFNFDDAFKALDEIEIPVAEKGIRANRVDLKESMKRVDKFELLFEDFYDVNNADDMNAVSEEREAEVAKAKLARIEKIVDLDAETEDDILPSYVGKTIIQCPQCMTLFYKNAEDIVRDEENPDVVNVNEVCQHCGNESGYDVVGKVAEETEAAPGDELGTDDFSAEVGDGENDIAIDDGSETTEEAPAEEGGEVDELSAEADLDSLDLDAELDLDEEPVEEEEANESLNTSKLLKKIEDKNDLKTEHESEKLTLNEDAELNKQLDLYNDFIKYLQKMVEQDEDALEIAKKQGNKEVIAAIQKRLDNSKAELEAALPDTVKDDANTEELPDATEAGIEDATDNTSDETEATSDETEETTESLHEAVESMTDTLNRAWEVAKKTNSPIGVTVVTPVGAGTMGKLKDWSKSVNANLYYVDAKNPDLMANGFDEKMISRPDTIIVIDEFNRAPADTQKAISNEIDNLDTQVEMVIAISNDSNINGDNFKRFKQYVVVVEKETATESLTEDVSMTSSPENFKTLLGTKEFKKPVSQEEVESYFESVDTDEEETEEDDKEISITVENGEPLTEDSIFNKSWWSKIGVYEKLLIIAQAYKCNYLSFVPLLSSKDVKPDTYVANRYPQTYIETPCYSKIKTVDIQTLVAEYQSKSSKKTAISKIKAIFNESFNTIKPLVASGSFTAEDGKYFTTVHSDAVKAFANAAVDYAWIILSREEIKVGAPDFASAQKLGQQLEAATQNKPNIRLVGSFNKSTKDFDWDMTAIKGAGLNNMLEGAKQKLANGDTDDEEEETPVTKTGDSDDKGKKPGEADEVDEAPVESSSEPNTPEARKPYLEKIIEKSGKKFIGIKLNKNGKSFIPIGKTKISLLSKAEKFEELLKMLPAVKILGMPVDTAILLVDAAATYEVGKEITGKTLGDTDFLAKCPAGGKATTNLKAVADSLGIAMEAEPVEDDDDFDMEESFKASNIDEKSFNEALTESLTNVYENVSDFTMTDCTLNGQQLMVEGVIAFVSGKTKTTSYIFEARKATEADSITLYGTNKDLFESGEVNLNTQVLNETLYAKSLSYKYTIKDKLIEGIIKK